MKLECTWCQALYRQEDSTAPPNIRYYFCSLQCYESWLKETKEDEQEEQT
jgi:hypothetical protein